MIELKHAGVSKVINVPTSVNDITADVLEKLSANIVIPEHYVLIALCWKVSFGTIFFNKTKQKEAQVICLAAKANEPDPKYDWIKVGKKLIISRSGIEMGVHVHIPHAASINSIAAWADEATRAENPNAKGMNLNILPSGDFVLVEFKVIPVNNITGCIEKDILDDDPFLNINAEKKSE